jgi:hypothetical protein
MALSRNKLSPGVSFGRGFFIAPGQNGGALVELDRVVVGFTGIHPATA